MKKLLVGLVVSLSLLAGSASAARDYMKCGSIGVVSGDLDNLKALGYSWKPVDSVLMNDGYTAIIFDNRKDGSILRISFSEKENKINAGYYKSAADNFNGKHLLVGSCR